MRQKRLLYPFPIERDRVVVSWKSLTAFVLVSGVFDTPMFEGEVPYLISYIDLRGIYNGDNFRVTVSLGTYRPIPSELVSR